jgi:hypothetical protein
MTAPPPMNPINAAKNEAKRQAKLAKFAAKQQKLAAQSEQVIF